MLKRFAFFSLVICALALNAFAHGGYDTHQEQQDVKVKVVKITDSIYMLQGAGGNIGVLKGKDGLLLIDDDVSQVTPKIAEALKQFDPMAPKYIFNTHWHFDHVGGNNFFGKEGSIFISHINVRNRVMKTVTMFGQEIKALDPAGWPMFTFEQSMSVHFNGDEVKAMHYPAGHTDGDSIIWFKNANVVHMGDQFFSGFFPFIDLDSGGTIDGYTRNVAAVIEKINADTKIIPGHGPLSNIEDLKKFHAMLVETSDIVRKGIKKKKTLDQLKKEGLPEKYKPFGAFFIKTDEWIETLYKGLGGKPEMKKDEKKN